MTLTKPSLSLTPHQDVSSPYCYILKFNIRIMDKMFHPVSMFEKIELYQDHNSKWRWRISKNGRIMASSPDAFEEKKECILNLKTFGAQILKWSEND